MSIKIVTLLGKAVGVLAWYELCERQKSKIYNAMGFDDYLEYSRAFCMQVKYGSIVRGMMFSHQAANDTSLDSTRMIQYFYANSISHYQINHNFYSTADILTTKYSMFLKHCESYGMMFLMGLSVDEAKDIPEFRADKPKNRWFCYDWNG